MMSSKLKPLAVAKKLTALRVTLSGNAPDTTENLTFVLTIPSGITILSKTD
ncbi:hypothetical protein ACPENL_003240 [Yersinia enterocolitica]